MREDLKNQRQFKVRAIRWIYGAKIEERCFSGDDGFGCRKHVSYWLGVLLSLSLFFRPLTLSHGLETKE